MHYYASERPRDPRGLPLMSNGAVLPSLVVRPLESGLVEIGVFLLTAPNNARYFSSEIWSAQLPGYLDSWRDDPERYAKEWWGWQYSAPQRDVTFEALFDDAL